jgi:hypothetical protein
MRHLCKWTTLAEHQWTSNVRQLTNEGSPTGKGSIIVSREKSLYRPHPCPPSTRPGLCRHHPMPNIEYPTPNIHPPASLSVCPGHGIIRTQERDQHPIIRLHGARCLLASGESTVPFHQVGGM